MKATQLNKLNAKQVKAAESGLHNDGGGLYLKVRGNGRSWLFRYSFDGKKREMGIGSASTVSLAKARQKAQEARELLDQGLHPKAVKATPAAPQPNRGPTFEEAMQAYIHAHNPIWSNAKHGKQWDSSLRRHAGPLLNMRVDEITAAHVADVLSPIWLVKCETASRVRQRIERVMSASIARGDRAGPNPAGLKDNLEHILPPQKKVRVTKHHAAVPVSEAPAAFQAILGKRDRGIGYNALITLILTACRSGEIRHLEWSDVAGNEIVIPAARMKARKAHRVPLTAALRQHLEAQPRLASSPLVHPGQSGRSMSDMTMAKALKNNGYPDFTPHGWRSTFSDWANGEGWPRELIEDQLAHQIGTAVERAYRRGDYLERRREMMEAWSAFLQAPQ